MYSNPFSGIFCLSQILSPLDGYEPHHSINNLIRITFNVHNRPCAGYYTV